MGVVLGLGIFWTLYGLAGILGFQVIDEKYKNRDWTPEYIRYRGISWLMIGIPWLVLYLLAHDKGIHTGVIHLLVAACGLPSIVYSFASERKYRRLLKEG